MNSITSSPKPLNSISKPIITLSLTILMIGGIVGSGYYFRGHELVRNLLLRFYKVPFAGEYIESQFVGANKIRVIIDHDNLSNRVIKNAETGRLMVITGRVKNNYSCKRSNISVTGKIYMNRKIVKDETVYCGNVISDTNLENLKYDAIKSKLSNASGHNFSNENIFPGKTIPFMVVFSNPPNGIDQYTIEAAGSSPAKDG